MLIDELLVLEVERLVEVVLVLELVEDVVWLVLLDDDVDVVDELVLEVE